MEGSSSTPLFEADRVSKIKEALSSIQILGLKPLVILPITAQGISIIKQPVLSKIIRWVKYG